jgi:RimJ/RimL family protein N-acetyltransferase
MVCSMVEAAGVPGLDGLVIRPEVEADVEGVIDVLEAVGAEGRWIGTEVPFDREARAEAMRRSLVDPATFGGFVVDDGGRIVGSIGLHLAPYGVVDIGMALLDGYRGRGLGTRLVEKGVAWAQGAGAHKLSLQVWPHNERAIGLYRKMGFVEEGRLRRHYRRRNAELWDAVVMGLLLADDAGAGGAGHTG